MAQNEDIKDIKRNVEHLAKTSGKTIKVKLPKDNGGEENYEMTVIDILCGIVGPMYGLKGNQKNIENLIKKPAKDSLFGKMFSVFNLLGNDVFTNLANNQNAFSKIYGSADDSRDFFASAVTQGIQNIFKNSSEVKAINTNIEDIGNSIKEMANNIEEGKDATKVNLEVTGDLSTFKDILNSLEKLNFENLGGKEIDPSVLEGNISKVLSLTKKGGPLYELFNNIRDLGDLSQSKYMGDAIKAIKELFNLVTTATSISFRQTLRMKKSLKYLRWFLMNDVVKLTQEISKTAEVSKAQMNSIQAIAMMFESVTKVADLGLKKQLRIKLNMWMFRHLLLGSIVKIIDSIEKQLGKKNTEKAFKSIQNTFNLFNRLIELKQIKIMDIFKAVNKIDMLSEITDALEDFEDEVKKLNFTDLQKQLKIAKTNIDKIIEIMDGLPKLRKLINYNLRLNSLKPVIKNIEAIFDEKKGSLAQIKFKDFSKDITKIKKATELTKHITSITKELVIVGKTRKGIEKGVKALGGIADKLKVAVGKFDKIKVDPKQLDRINRLLKNLRNIVVGSVAILIIAGLAMKFINPLDLVLFTACLAGFIFTISFTFKRAARGLRHSLKGVHYLRKLIMTSATALIIGAIFMQGGHAKNALLFAAALAGFVSAVIFAVGFAGRGLRKVYRNIKRLGLIVLAASAVMLLGGAVGAAVGFDNVMLFGTILSLFIMSVVIAVLVAPRIAALMSGSPIAALRPLHTVMKSIWRLGVIVFASGIVLALGGAVAAEFGGGVMLFGFVLATFIMAIIIAVLVAPRIAAILSGSPKAVLHPLKSVMGSLVKIGAIVLVSGVVLMLGGLVAKEVGIGTVALFALILGGFIFGMLMAILWSVKLVSVAAASKTPLLSALRTMAEFGPLVFLSGITLVLGGFMMKFIKPGDLILFAGVLALFIVGITLPFILSKKPINKAIGPSIEFSYLVGISGLTLIAGGLAMKFINPVDLIVFTVILGAFIYGLSFAYNNFKGSKKVLQRANLLALVVAVSGATLLAGGLIMAQNPDMAWAAPLFAVTLLGLISGMALVAKLLDKTKIKNNTLATLAVITAVIIGGALAVKEMAKTAKIMQEGGGVGNLLIVAGTVASIITIVTAITLGLAAALGNGITTIAAYAAIGVLLAAAAAIWVVTDAMCKVAKSMDDFAKIPKLDSKKLISNINVVVDMAKALSPLISMSLGIALAALAMQSLASLLSTIAEAVSDYADLKIAKYEGTKVVGYRHLEKKDFDQAALNVKTIITTLGGAVIDTYNEKPELFELEGGILGFGAKTKFGIVANALSKLGPMLSTIAIAVKNYADLKVAEYGEGTKVIAYRHLEDEDFNAAARNVKTIISVLGGAVIETYDENPELFATEGGIFGFGAKTKFGIVANALSKLGPMLSVIAMSVKNYADLKVEEDWEKDPKSGKLKVSKYRHLDDTDFENAAKNVKKIITVLGGVIIEEYEEHPELYVSEGGIFGFGATNPFERVVGANMKLGQMITVIAMAVKNYANFTVGENYKMIDGKLQPTKYRHLTSNDFKEAAKNIKSIITLLGGVMVEEYEEHPELYVSEGGIFGFGATTPFERVVGANMKLANLISSIGQSVQRFANFRIETKWDPKTGKPIDWEHLTQKHFNDATKCIQSVLDTLGKSILDYANSADPAIKEAFQKEGGFLGFGGTTKFERIVTAVSSLGKLINDIAQGVLAYAQGKIETKWDPKTGKAIEFEHLGPKHFTEATINISMIVSTLGSALFKIAGEHPTWFDDDDDSEFSIICKSVGNMGKMINDIATGVAAWARLEIPTGKVDKDGKPEYKPIDSNGDHGKGFIDQATKNITAVVGTMGGTIVGMANDPDMKEWFEDGEDSTFYKVVNACMKMGEMISGIAQGLQEYSNLRFPTKFDVKGQPIAFADFESKKGQDIFINAAKNIATVIGILGLSIMALYNGEFIVGFDDNKNPKYESIEGLSKEDAQAMFDIKVDPSNGTILGESNFAKVMNSCKDMGQLIGGIAEGIQVYANNKVPIKWDKNGKPIDFQEMTHDYFQKAGENIAKVITFVGKAITDVFFKPEFKKWFEIGFWSSVRNAAEKNKQDKYDMNTSVMMTGSGGIPIAVSTSNVEKTAENTKLDPNDTPALVVLKSVMMFGGIISSIAQGIQVYANITDKNLDFDKAGKNIAKIITHVGQSITQTYEKNKTLFDNPNLDKITDAFVKISGILGPMAKYIQTYADFKYVVVDGTMTMANGKLNGGSFKTEKFEEGMFEIAKTNIQKSLTTVFDAIYGAYNHEYEDENNKNSNYKTCPIKFFLTNSDTKDKIFNLIDEVVKKSTPLISNVMESIKTYIELSDKYTEAKLKKGKEFIGELINFLPKTMYTSITDHMEIFKDITTVDEKVIDGLGVDSSSKEEKVITGTNPFTIFVGGISNLVSILDDLITYLQGFGTAGKLGKVNDDGTINWVTWNKETAKDNMTDILEVFISGLSYIKENTVKWNWDNIQTKLKGIDTSLPILRNIFFKENGIYSFFEEASKINFSEVKNKLWEMLVGSVQGNSMELTQTYDSIPLKTAQYGIFPLLVLLYIRMINVLLSDKYAYGGKKEEHGNNEQKYTFTEILSDAWLPLEFLPFKMSTINSKILSIKDNYSKLVDGFKDLTVNDDEVSKIGKIISTYVNVADIFDKAQNSFDSVVQNGLTSNMLTNTWIGDEYSINNNLNSQIMDGKVAAWTYIVNEIIELSKKSEKYEQGFSIMSTGISIINKAVQEIHSSKEFEKFKDNTGEFVKTVSKIDVKKFGMMNDFVNSVIKLTNKLGNVDKLTEAIADRLTVALDYLSAQLTEAKNTIKNAEKMQKSRQEAIKKSIGEVRSLMDKELKVTVTAVADGSSLTPTGPGDTPVGGDNTTLGETPTPTTDNGGTPSASSEPTEIIWNDKATGKIQANQENIQKAFYDAINNKDRRGRTNGITEQEFENIKDKFIAAGYSGRDFKMSANDFNKFAGGGKNISQSTWDEYANKKHTKDAMSMKGNKITFQDNKGQKYTVTITDWQDTN